MPKLCFATQTWLFSVRHPKTPKFISYDPGKSLKGSNFQASTTWVKFELVTLSLFGAMQDPTRLWFCPEPQWMLHTVLMGWALQGGSTWHEIKAGAVGNDVSVQPCWEHSSSCASGRQHHSVSSLTQLLALTAAKGWAIITFCWWGELGKSEQRGQQVTQRTFVVRNRKVLIKLLLGTGAQLESLQIQIAAQLVTWRWKTVIVH